MRSLSLPLVAVALVVLGLSVPAQAGVALAVQLTGSNPVHRDFVAGVADEARARWAMLPPLKAAIIDGCRASDKCLRGKARLQGASHLVIVGVSELGASDFVVVLRVIDLATRRELANFNDLATPGKDPRSEGRRVAQLTFDRTKELPVAVAKPDRARPDATAPTGEVEPELIVQEHPYSGLSPVSAIGWGLTGVGIGAAAVMGGVAASGFLADGVVAKREALDSALIGLPVAVAIAGAGLATVSVDALLSQGEPPMDLLPPAQSEPPKAEPVAATTP